MGRLLHQGRPGRRFLAPVLWAYGDESGGTDEASNLLALAGYVAPAESWGVFAERWSSTLRPHPEISRFHTAQCLSGKGEFRDWSKDKSLELVLQLVEIIISTTDIRGFCSIIERGEPQNRTGPFGWIANDPFASAFGSVVHGLCKRAGEIDGREKVAFIFDRQQEWADDALRHYREMATAPDLTHSNRMGTVAFEPSEGCFPLQAADLLSHQIRRYKEKGREETSTVKTLERLCGEGRVQVDILSKNLVDTLYWSLAALGA